MIPLPIPVMSYVQAVNACGTSAALRCLSPAAHVHDEGRDYHGSAEIAAWLARTQQATPFTLAVTHAEPMPNETVVTMHVTGTFPGSPLQLTFHFKLSSTHISELRIQG